MVVFNIAFINIFTPSWGNDPKFTHIFIKWVVQTPYSDVLLLKNQPCKSQAVPIFRKVGDFHGTSFLVEAEFS